MSSSKSSFREKARAIKLILLFRPRLSIAIVLFGIVTALLEGVGLSFIVPIIEAVQSGGLTGERGGLVGMFFEIYRFLGIPFTLNYLILGVVGIMTVRYASSFMVAWLRARLRTQYMHHLQVESFSHALSARIEFFDVRGSDDILNTIVTQTFYAGRAIKRFIVLLEQILLCLLYLAIAFYLAPQLTTLAIVLFGGFGYLSRNIVETGYNVGDRVAEANERVQEVVQAGTQGIRSVKLFGISDRMYDDFRDAADEVRDSSAKLRRNDAFVTNFNQLLSAVMVFVFIYLLVRVSSLSFSAFALFLFAIFRLAPRVSTVNQKLYQAEGDLPHVIRTNRFIEDLSDEQEPTGGTRTVPDPVRHVEFDSVSFAYQNDEQVLRDLNVSIQQNQFVAFVGPSGAGKSTIVSLLARMYAPDSGEVRVNRTPIADLEKEEWRSKLGVVPQNPFLFNETLRYNLTLGNRDATEEEIRECCSIARVDEFLDDLPEGLDSNLGDNGVQLSGGQRQRVALARALLKEDAEILVLDEATSNLDSDTEREVQRRLAQVDDEYMVVAIAHRLSTVKDADCIYVLEDGRIAEQGRHSDLVSKDGTYAELYATQIKG